MATDLERLKGRLASARADVEGKPSADELEIALEEIQALWDELHQQVDRLAYERARSALVFNQAPLACVITDVHGNVLEANLAALALLEVPAAYVGGKPLVIFFTDPERDAFRRTLVKAANPLNRAESWSSELKAPGAHPSKVQMTVRAFGGEGRDTTRLFWYMRTLD